MERYQLTRKEYEDLHEIVSKKRAIKEMLESLKTQLASAIIEEDKWWQKIVKKHGLNNSGYMYSIDHGTREIVVVPKPDKNQKSISNVEKVRVRERAPELNKLVTPEELEAMRKM